MTVRETSSPRPCHRTATIAAGLLLLVAAASPASAQVCGNAVREAGEQCDDGNTRNLDGCSTTCGLEQTHRINSLVVQDAPELDVCSSNRLGSAFAGTGFPTFQSAVSSRVASGLTSILFHFRGLDDLTGTADNALQLGLLSAAPILPGAATYSGSSDLDWWYAIDTGQVDAQGVPLSQLAATLSGHQLTAGPGHATFKMALSDQPAPVAFSSLVISLPTGASSAPATAAAGRAPGHEAYEHLDPALQSFASAGAGDTGSMCGNLRAASLAATPIPAAWTGGGCQEGYTGANSLLDVIVHGCTTASGVVVHPSQPDQDDPDVPAVGSGPPYLLLTEGATNKVYRCRDRGFVTQDLPSCLADAAYSSYFKLASGRVVAVDDGLFADGFESGDTSAWSATATDNGDLTVTPAAAMAGTLNGLQGDVNDTSPLYVEDSTPLDEDHYRARFWIDPSAFDPGEASGAHRTRVFIGFEATPTRRLFAVVLRRQGGQYSLIARVRGDSGAQTDAGPIAIGAGPHRVGMEWVRASSAADDGVFRLTLDGTLVATLPGLANRASSIDFVRLGALSVKSGASGTLAWDEFVSHRRSPVP